MIIQNLSEIQNKVMDKAKDFLIVFVSNVKGKSDVSNDYSGLSVIGDYYTMSQLQDIVQAIRNNRYEVLCYFHENEFIKDYLDKKFEAYSKDLLVINTAKTGISVGRKSLIPAFCELNSIKYFGCNPYTVSFAKDKYHWHLLLRNYNLPICNYWLFHKTIGWTNNKRPPKGIKIIAKLNSESCSMGIGRRSIENYTPEYDSYLQKLSSEYNQHIIVEEFISGYEIEVPLLISHKNKIIFEPMGIVMDNGFNLEEKILDYDARVNGTYDFKPFKYYNSDICKQIKEYVKTTSEIMDLQGFCRIDFRINNDFKFYITDIATTPFFSRYSSVRLCFEAEGYRYEDFFTLLLYILLEKYDLL